MAGGSGWDPGEATDDTQMAILVAESLLACSGFDPADLFARFHRWASAEPKDLGLQTEAVLTSGRPWDRAAAEHAATTGRAAGYRDTWALALDPTQHPVPGQARHPGHPHPMDPRTDRPTPRLRPHLHRRRPAAARHPPGQ